MILSPHRLFSCVMLLILGSALVQVPVQAQVDDPFDSLLYPGDSFSEPQESESDAQKSAEELYREGFNLMQGNQPLEGRTKLLRALAKDPTYYPAHLQLAFYYIAQVGHYRLAMKYVKRAQELFEQKHGPPPYDDQAVKMEHAQVLYLLSQARLNLDDYKGALQALDDFENAGYFAPWYPGTRAWVLMKLGQLQKAIEVARLGVLSRADPGRTLNMLGILLSMTGDPVRSLQVFREAISYEISLGEMGQPATPLNNSGEVYKESFDDTRAAEAWQRAKSLHDGCEHVLPSLNLALLQVDHLDLRGAQGSMNSFLTCFSQYTLRNDEEHRALVHLMRGRIALLSGLADVAIAHLERAIDNIQWFGKIGTSEGDLRAGTTVSLARAFDLKIHDLQTKKTPTWTGWLTAKQELLAAQIRSWWFKRRSRQILAEELNNFEDLRVRHTDSLLEYPTLGEALTGFPVSALKRRIEIEKKSDSRSQALPFYTLYLAENHLKRGNATQALELIDSTLATMRPKGDELLWVHATALKIRAIPLGSPQRDKLTIDLFAKHPPALRIYGLPLPVVIQGSDEHLARQVQGTLLRPVAPGSSPYILSHHNATPVSLTLSGPTSRKQASGSDLDVTINNLLDAIFTLEVGEEIMRL